VSALADLDHFGDVDEMILDAVPTVIRKRSSGEIMPKPPPSHLNSNGCGCSRTLIVGPWWDALMPFPK